MSILARPVMENPEGVTVITRRPLLNRTVEPDLATPEPDRRTVGDLYS